MTRDNLAAMANQIADFFAAYPEDEAIDGVAAHIRKFWDPRMRAKLQEKMDAGAEGLSPLARKGAERLFSKP